VATFEALGVPPIIRQALSAMRYDEPTPVQELGIPALLAGGDVVLEAQTGSGKTAAFGVPAVAVGSRGAGVRVLVLVPTRELARQVADEVREIGAGSPFRAVAVTGGVAAEKEERTIAGDVRCIVATPGRLIALLEEQRVRLDRLDLVILDEADRMLDMGFRADIERVLEACKERKQTVLVSATLPRAVVQLAQQHLHEPQEVRASARKLPAGLTHHRLNVFGDQKERAVLALLHKESPERAIVFVRTRNRAASYSKLLKKAGFQADALQGDMSHEQRRHVFDLFARGVAHILVATDIASRGLDVPEMQLVINADIPDEPGAYTHRAGRAARLNRPGRVITLIEPDEKADRIRLESESGGEWTPYPLTAAAIAATMLPGEGDAAAPRKGGAKKASGRDARAGPRDATGRGARAGRPQQAGRDARTGPGKQAGRPGGAGRREPPAPAKPVRTSKPPESMDPTVPASRRERKRPTE
jgi:ATP-dependent RNA helicase DeaD